MTEANTADAAGVAVGASADNAQPKADAGRPPLQIDMEENKFVDAKPDGDADTGQPAEKAEGDTEGDKSEPKAELTPEEKHQKELKKLQNAISYRDKKAWKLQAQLEAERAENARLKAAQLPAEPKESDFEGKEYKELLRAEAEYASDKKLHEREIKASDERIAAIQREYDNERNQVLSASAAEAKKTIPDFASTMSEHAAKIDSLPPSIASAILESDNAPLALYSIIKDGLFDEFASLSPFKAAAMLARHEDKGVQLTKIKTVSNAPAPMTPTRGAASVSKDPSQMTDAEYSAWRRQRLAKR